jgi:hypothetical protein
MQSVIRLVTNWQWASQMRELGLVRKAMVELTAWVGQREAYRLARISKPALSWARTHGKIDAVHVGRVTTQTIRRAWLWDICGPSDDGSLGRRL